MRIKKKKFIPIFIGVSILISGGVLGLSGYFGGGGKIPEDTFTRGLAGYWNFDEGSGQTVYDISNNGNNATLASSTDPSSADPKWTPGKVGGGLSFDGVNDYVDCGNNASLQNIFKTNGTLEFWVHPNSDWNDGNNHFLFRAGDPEGHFWMYKDWNQNFLTTKIGDGTTYIQQQRSVTWQQRWYHITLSWENVGTSNTIIKTYIDAIAQTSTGSTGTPSIGNIYVGRVGDSTNGTIDDVRIYNRALSAEEIRYHYNRGGPVGHWRFEEGSGQIVYDSTTNNNDGTLASSTDISSADPTWTTGKYGGALSFDGVNDYVDAGSAPSLDAVTVEAWVNLRDTNEEVLFVGGRYAEAAYNSNYQAFGIKSYNNYVRAGVYASGGQAVWHNDDNTTIISSLSSNLNQWIQIVFTWDGTSGIINTYKNGVFVAQKSGITGIITNYGGYGIKAGTRGDLTQYFNGTIDDIRIYNYARTPEEIRLDYNAGYSARFGPTTDCNSDPGSCMTKGLAGYWSFNEGTDQTAFDGSGNSNNGTLGSGSNPDSSDPKWTPGKSGGGLSFDGVNDYVDAGNGASLNLGSNTYSLEVWIKTTMTDVNAVGRIIDKHWGTGQGSYTLRQEGDGRILLYPYDGTFSDTLYSISTTNDGNWHHVVGIRDGVNLFIYIDGKLDNQKTTTIGIQNPNGYFNIGRYISGNSEFFLGLIDEVRIYNRALSAEEIRYHYNRGGSVAHWKMDEGSGSIINDYSSNNNDGTLNLGTSGNTATSSAWVSGKYGSALSFDGVDDYVKVSKQIEFTKGTIESWVFIKNTNDSRFLSMSSDNDFWTGIYSYNGKVRALIWNGSSNISVDSVSSASIYLNKWIHVTATADGSNLKLYINGILDNQISAGDIVFLGDKFVYIGSHSSGGYFNGLIDDVRIYNYARTPEEIRLDYNAGYSARFGPNTDCNIDPGSCMTKGLAGYWSLNEGMGQYAYDTSGNANNATLATSTDPSSADPKWTPGKVGGGLSFDGVNDYVSIGNQSALNLRDSLTAELWMYSTGNTGWDVWLNNTQYIIEKISTTQCWVAVRKNSSWVGEIYSSACPENQWLHVVLTYDGSNTKLYVNGISQGSNSVVAPLDNASNLYINDGDVSQNAKGLIDDVRIYNRALSAEEIRFHYNRGGPVGHWKMDEGSGQTVYDSTENNNDGTLATSTDVSSADPTWTTGKYGGALSFDGVNDYVNLNSVTGFSQSYGTISIWINPNSTFWISNSEGYIVNLQQSSPWRYFILRKTTSSPNRIQFMVYNGSVTYSVLKDTSWNSGWHHIVATWSEEGTNDSMKLYIDGILENTNNAASLPSDITSYDARKIGGDVYFNGTIDDVRIYNYTRTPEQILQDYNAGFGIYFK